MSGHSPDDFFQGLSDQMEEALRSPIPRRLWKTNLDAYNDARYAEYPRVGEIRQFAGAAPPASLWLPCDGGLSSRSGEPALWLAVGNMFGGGDGSTTFNRPNLNGKRMSTTFTSGPLQLDGVFPPAPSPAFGGNFVDTYNITATTFPKPSGGGDTQSNIDMLLVKAGVPVTASNYRIVRNYAVGSGSNSASGGPAYNENIAAFYGPPSTASKFTWAIQLFQPGQVDYTEVLYAARGRDGANSEAIENVAGEYKGNDQMTGICFYSLSTFISGSIEVVPVGGSLVPSYIRRA